MLALGYGLLLPSAVAQTAPDDLPDVQTDTPEGRSGGKRPSLTIDNSKPNSDADNKGKLAPDVPSSPDGIVPSPDPALPDLAPAPELESDAEPSESLADAAAKARPDIIITNDAERAQKLDELFEKLAKTEDESDANLVAEEIWAVWLQSGSASIDYVLVRGSTAQKSGNLKLAARMYDHVIRLEPEYAEGWVRSGRLALETGDLGQAMHDVTQGLVYEPRHFYALWTLGNIFEKLGQNDEAFEAYTEALKLYPALKAVKDRVDYLSDDVEGEAL